MVNYGAMADGSCGLGGRDRVGLGVLRRVLCGRALDATVGLYATGAVHEAWCAWRNGGILAAASEASVGLGLLRCFRHWRKISERADKGEEVVVELTGSGRGGGVSRGRMGVDGNREPLGHDLTRADRTPNGVEGDVDGVHGVGGGMSGKGRRDLLPGLITQLVPPGTRVADY